MLSLLFLCSVGSDHMHIRQKAFAESKAVLSANYKLLGGHFAYLGGKCAPVNVEEIRKLLT